MSMYVVMSKKGDRISVVDDLGPMQRGDQLLAEFRDVRIGSGYVSARDMAETLVGVLKDIFAMERRAENEAAAKVRTRGASPSLVTMVEHLVEASERGR